MDTASRLSPRALPSRAPPARLPRHRLVYRRASLVRCDTAAGVRSEGRASARPPGGWWCHLLPGGVACWFFYTRAAKRHARREAHSHWWSRSLFHPAQRPRNCARPHDARRAWALGIPPRAALISRTLQRALRASCPVDVTRAASARARERPCSRNSNGGGSGCGVVRLPCERVWLCVLNRTYPTIFSAQVSSNEKKELQLYGNRFVQSNVQTKRNHTRKL